MAYGKLDVVVEPRPSGVLFAGDVTAGGVIPVAGDEIVDGGTRGRAELVSTAVLLALLNSFRHPPGL